MYQIEMHQVSDDFVNCWRAAITHLETKGREGIKWLKSDLIPPFLEHTSFRIGNQLFFVRIEDKENELDTPSNPDGLNMISRGCNGKACLMPMRRKGAGWETEMPGWGLIDPETKKMINPYDIVSIENIIMTDWEIQDFAVKVVRNHLEDVLGYKILSSQGNPSVQPSLWFESDKKNECVIVGSARFGENMPELPANIEEVFQSVSCTTNKVYFATVSFYHPEQKNNKEVLPLYRGHNTGIQFSGLTLLT